MEQEIFWGPDQLEKLAEGGRCFLVHGGSFARLPIAPIFQGLDCVDFTDFSPNPTYEQVKAALNAYHSGQCSQIAAVGGGSAIDVAKCVKRFARMDPEGDLFTQQAPCAPVPLTAVPTTAGTGSESTHFAVLYRDGRKHSIAHPDMLPNQVVLVPAVLDQLPLYQKKCTMLDALCQAMESIWARRATPASRALARRAVQMIRDHWQAYLLHNDSGAAPVILEAANLAGQAINVTTTTAPHAMSYGVTSRYHLPHGHAVALCMAEVWGYTRSHMDDCPDRDQLARALEEIESLVSLEWFVSLLDQLDIQRPTPVNRAQELDQLAASVDPQRLGNHPVRLDGAALRALYEGVVQL